MLNVTQEKEFGHIYKVTGEVEGKEVVAEYNRYSGKVTGKGSRTHKEIIAQAVADYERDKQRKIEEENQNKIDRCKQQIATTDISVLDLYKVTVIDVQESTTSNYIVNGARLFNLYNVVEFEPFEPINTDLFVSSQRWNDLTDTRILTLYGRTYVTGLTVAEMASKGIVLDELHHCSPFDKQLILDKATNANTMQPLFASYSNSDMSSRFHSEMERAKMGEMQAVEPKFSSDGKEIKFALFASKPCNLKDVEEFSIASSCNYVIAEQLEVTTDLYDQFVTSSFEMSVLNSNFTGGSVQEENNVYSVALRLIAPDRPTLLVDPQGYDYGRYIALELNPSTLIRKGEIVAEQRVDGSEFENNSNNKIEQDKSLEPVTVESSIVSPVTVKMNEQLNGIELHFASKPTEQERNELKSNGFRWSKRGFWYAKQSSSTLLFIKRYQSSQAETEGNNEQSNEQSNTVTYPASDTADKEKYIACDPSPTVEESSEHIPLSKIIDTADILDMFDSIETNEETNLIPAELSKYIAEQVALFEEALSQQETIQAMQKNLYINIKIDVRTDHLYSNIKKFINDKYSFDIDYYKMEKLKIDPTIDEITNYILAQLDGKSLDNAQIEQKRGLLQEVITYKKVKSIKNKILIADFLYIEDTWSGVEMGYKARDRFAYLIDALTIFLEEDLSRFASWENKDGHSIIRKTNFDLITTHEINERLSIKIYKNGKLELIFTNSADAQSFAREWLNAY